MIERFEPQQILCPVDFSQHSALALRIAGEIAAPFNAEVMVLHAQRFEPPLYFTAAQTAAVKAQLQRSQRAARRYLEDFAQKQLPKGVRHSIGIIEADPAPAILEEAKKADIGLIVMGTHGRTGLTKIRLGSVTESVLRQTKIPILTIGPQVDQLSAGCGIHRIFCPVDYSEPARAAFETAVILSEKLKADLIVAHVLEGGGALEPARQALCDWVPASVRQQCSIREVVRQGEPAEQILSELKASKADLLVIGATPRNVFDAMLFGSAAEKLIRSAPAPVFSVIGNPKGKTTA